MSHTCEWVMSLFRISHCTHRMSHVWMSHVPHVNKLWHTKECVTNEGVTHEWVMSDVWMSCGTQMNVCFSAFHYTLLRISQEQSHMKESCHTCEWVTSHMWMSHVTHINQSGAVTYERVMSHIWINHISRRNENILGPTWWVGCSHLLSAVSKLGIRHPRKKERKEWNMSKITCEWVMSHAGMYHVSHKSESWHKGEWVISHVWISCDTRMETWGAGVETQKQQQEFCTVKKIKKIPWAVDVGICYSITGTGFP